MTRTLTAVVLAFLLLSAGCSGGGRTTATPTGERATPSPTAHTTTPTPIDEPNGTTVAPARVVAFEDLTERQRSAFREATDGEVQFVPPSTYIDGGYDYTTIGPFEDHDFVRYEGELYRIELHEREGELYASYTIETSPGTPGNNDTVVAFDGLPRDVQDEVRVSITEGEYHTPFGMWQSIPDSLDGVEYVRYENRTYEMGYVVSDSWASILTVEKVE